MNFCDPCFDSKISCNKPTADGYEATNLVSLNKNGFICEYFVKPPVDLKVTFPIPIDVSHIVIDTSIKCYHSVGISIFTEIDKEAINASNPGGSDDIFMKVGHYFLNTETKLFAKNHYYKHWISSDISKSPLENGDPVVYNCSLKHSNKFALRCVKTIIVRIYKTKTVGPAALCSLEVWGQPAINADQTTKKYLIRKWESRIANKAASVNIPSMYNSTQDESPKQLPSTTEVTTTEKEDKMSELPEDFLDPLTCELMTVPLLLPSGHSIDMQTLERYIKNESQWCRPASDPFTGVPFSQSRKPDPNVPLKARIDRFVLMNDGHPELKGIGRTVGSSRYVSKNQSVLPLNVKYNYSNLESQAVLINHSVDNMNVKKRKIIDSSTDQFKIQNSHPITKNKVKNSLDLEVEAALQGLPSYLPSTYSLDRPTTSGVLKINKSAENRKHGAALSSSLEYSSSTSNLTVSSVNIVRHTKQCQDSTYDIKTLYTTQTNCACKVNEGLYLLRCNHVMCRLCLLKEKTKDIKCPTCNEVTSKNNIEKYHPKSLFS